VAALPPSPSSDCTGTAGIPTGTVPDDVWSHAAARWDGALLQLYLNGALTGSYSLAIGFDTGEVRLASDNDLGVTNYFFCGLLDDVRLYNRVLSDAEITALATP
jgi:hypothetical protein